MMLRSLNQVSAGLSLAYPLICCLRLDRLHHGVLWAVLYLILAAPSARAQAPTITTQPESQIVRDGATATFSVPAEGELPLTYQWQFNGAALSSATNSSLILTNVQPP